MTSVVASSSNNISDRTEITWYACDQALPSTLFGPEMGATILRDLRKNASNLVPTTYEAANAYLQEELKKPKGDQNLLREMCMMLIQGLPKDRKAYFVCDAINTRIALDNGTMVMYPTMVLPPNSFGNRGDLGRIKSEMIVWDPPTDTPQQGVILLAYFTKAGPDMPSKKDIPEIRVKNSPFA